MMWKKCLQARNNEYFRYYEVDTKNCIVRFIQIFSGSKCNFERGSFSLQYWWRVRYCFLIKYFNLYRLNNKIDTSEVISYSYNKEGLLSHEIIKYEQSQSDIFFKYDERNRILKISVVEDNNVVDETLCSYEDLLPPRYYMVTEKYVQIPDIVILTRITFVDSLKREKDIIVISDGEKKSHKEDYTKEWKILRKYDESGLIAEEFEYNTNGDIVKRFIYGEFSSTTIFTYKYDKFGNWIEKEEIVRTESGEILLKYLYKRVIIYK